ncbi:hypothetical protein CQW23_00526 [Capsicum baccatum]|uniref:MADS-box domain-containing protein n=1 Tax=Capsicum baccatum TaxID=33114 RepID=A0A2G2XKZ1_CAPBA|nr:hypothetical protein CQW23_00526 [Capsicum baccatum]
MKLIESKEARTIAFSKRKNGLGKKAKEYSNLTGEDVGFILFTQAEKPHSYGPPSIEKIFVKIQAFKEENLDSEMPTDKHMLENRLKQFEAYKLRLDKIKSEIKGDVPAEQFKFISEVALDLEEMSS